MIGYSAAAVAALALGAFGHSQSIESAAPTDPEAAVAALPAAPAETPVPDSATLSTVAANPAPSDKPATAVLAIYTPLKVMLNEEISSQTAALGDAFTVTVLEDVVENGVVVVPKGSIGHGEVTFVTRKGGFGKPGILSITLRKLELGDRLVDLDGRYREEGKNNNGATAATWFAVGIFAGFIKGRAGYIEKGRELRAKTGEPIVYDLVAATEAPVVPTPTQISDFTQSDDTPADPAGDQTAE